jgi:hypothetical protein
VCPSHHWADADLLAFPAAEERCLALQRARCLRLLRACKMVQVHNGLSTAKRRSNYYAQAAQAGFNDLNLGFERCG